MSSAGVHAVLYGLEEFSILVNVVMVTRTVTGTASQRRIDEFIR